MRHRTQKKSSNEIYERIFFTANMTHIFPPKRQSTAEMENIRSRGSEELQLCGARHILPLCELSWY